jgi:hypothetical protein
MLPNVSHQADLPSQLRMLPHWLCLSLSAPQHLMTLTAAQDWMHGIGKQATRTSLPFVAERKFHAGSVIPTINSWQKIK